MTNYLLKSVRNFERGRNKAVSGATDLHIPILYTQGVALENLTNPDRAFEYE